jgi:rubredoxin
LNKYYDKYWLGIYRRDEMFSIEFLKDLCQLSLKTKLGQICSTPWKTLMVKSIEEKDRPSWNALLAKHKINVRHAANELNFQVEDACKEALELKHYLLKNLNLEDTRTYGICIGIKTKKKTEVFSSILVRRRPIFKIGKFSFFNVYDILCAKDFNPNERTGFVFSENNPKFLLGEQLRRAIFSFYAHQLSNIAVAPVKKPVDIATKIIVETYVHQCKHCLSVYDQHEWNIDGKETRFEDLPTDYTCPLCEAPKKDFALVGKLQLGLQAD